MVLYIHTDEPESEAQSPAKTIMEPSDANVGVKVDVLLLDVMKGSPDVTVDTEPLDDEDANVDEMSSRSRSTESPEGEKM